MAMMTVPNEIQQIGEYDVLDEIGRGGAAIVFRARHRLMKREVALKVLRADSVKSDQMIKRFLIELEVAGRLSHPNILRAYDAREVNGIHFLVMELVSGKDLAEVVRADGPLPVKYAVNCVLEAAAGLLYAHAQGVVHRDVKPANLALSKEGVVQVFDWGLARHQESITEIDQSFLDDPPQPPLFPTQPNSTGNTVHLPSQPHTTSAEEMQNDSRSDQGGEADSLAFATMCQAPHTLDANAAVKHVALPRPVTEAADDALSWRSAIIGTPAFMAPEQWQGSRVDQRADIYGLGGTFHFLLTGKPPFTGRMEEMFQKHLTERPPALVKERSDVSPELDEVFQKMVAKAVASRYQSMAEVIDGIKRAVGAARRPPKIFISYRREDSLDATDRIYQHLVRRFGENSVFMDMDAIPPGSDFRQHLQCAVSGCAVLIVVIGDHWLAARSKRSLWPRRRLDDRDDYVRIEIEAALSRKIPVIPVLVAQAAMPSAQQLPRTISALAYQQAAEVRPGREFAQHIDHLLQTVEAFFDQSRANPE